MRGFIVVMMLCAVQLLSAQIRIIPQDKLLDASEIKAVENTPLRWANGEVSFGTIDEMLGVWQGSAVLVNTSSKTIAVTQVKSTCGCLKAEFAKRVLAPKEQMKVALKYYPRGHAGRVRQRVLVYTNLSSEKPSAVLTLSGLVTASEDRSDDYPYTRGVLRLRQEQVVFEGAGRQVQRIAFMNGGSTELNLEVDTNLLPKGVSVRFEPSRVAPKGQGDVVVEYNPTEVTLPTSLGKIYIKGLNIPPRHSAIDVILKN
jgi:hypothetical protein